jgi:hypothetical protein
MTYLLTFIGLVFLSQIAASNVLQKYDNGVLTNLRKVDAQVEDYSVEVKYVIVPGIKNAKGLSRKVHKISAFGEEFVDKMPRLIWYTILYGTIFTIIGVVA